MKKSLFVAVAVCCGLCGCQQISLDDVEGDAQEQGAKSRSVQFVLKGLTVDYATRATLASEGMTDLWVWEGQTLLKHQVSTDADFGVPTVSLTIGAHDLTFVASKSEGQSFSEGQWLCTKVKDTFGTVLAYTVSGSSTSKQVQLSRLNGKVQWTIEDAMPAEAKTLLLNIEDQCFGLDASLDGVEAKAYKSSFNVSGYAGTTGLALSAMVLPASHSDGGQVDVSVTVKDGSDVVMCSYQNEITVKANEVCNIHGSFFSGGGAHEVSISNVWGQTTDYDIQ